MEKKMNEKKKKIGASDLNFHEKHKIISYTKSHKCFTGAVFETRRGFYNSS
jgi:hypothetical protein